MKTLTLALLLLLPLACTRPPPVEPPTAALPANWIAVPAVTHAADGKPLVRDPKGRFAAYYWRDGVLVVAEGTAPERIRELLEVGE
jgi:hypothetical protein